MSNKKLIRLFFALLAVVAVAVADVAAHPCDRHGPRQFVVAGHHAQ